MKCGTSDIRELVEQNLRQTSPVAGIGGKTSTLSLRGCPPVSRYRVLELALYHSRGKLSEPEATHEFFRRVIIVGSFGGLRMSRTLVLLSLACAACAGAQTYQMASVNRSRPPEFAVYRGAKKIASGNFEFG